MDVLRNRGAVLCLGAPSIARALEVEGRDVLLVDRQPWQGVRNHLAQEIDSENEILVSGMKTAILDPPWYPRDVLSWASVAGRILGPGRTMFMSIWPDNARPSAADERQRVVHTLEAWCNVTQHHNALQYEMPEFEKAAVRLSGFTPLSTSPRVGSLLELRVLHDPPFIARPCRRDEWIRYTVEDYQLAVRLNLSVTGKLGIYQHPEADGWIWPYVSARAPGIDKIDVWSSSGEVALVSDSLSLVTALRDALSADTISRFEESLASYPELLTWAIPRPPFCRSVEWRHRS